MWVMWCWPCCVRSISSVARVGDPPQRFKIHKKKEFKRFGLTGLDEHCLPNGVIWTFRGVRTIRMIRMVRMIRNTSVWQHQKTPKKRCFIFVEMLKNARCSRLEVCEIWQIKLPLTVRMCRHFQNEDRAQCEPHWTIKMHLFDFL